MVDPPGDLAFYERHGHTRVPQLVQWFATLRCPLDCAHCLAKPPGRAPAVDMPREAVLRLVDQVAEMGVQEFLITGGEPLLREDLAEIIPYLAERGVPYSLNTAAMPSTIQQAAFRLHPPLFVAVSLDGPAEVHDAFRRRQGAFAEAMESLRFFSSLPGCSTAAGTTVTTANYASLAETFHVVAASPAGHWGIHLLIPEGRAGDRPDLFLSRRQLRELLSFVMRRRSYFPIRLADELGYCGDLEPLLRDAPFQCGAGRAQCVVLPSGDVVPCTTLDLTVSAGSIHERSLADIWREGFSALRRFEPDGKCQECGYAPACGGGCWLQRRRGTHCHKHAWAAGDLMRNTAGLAMCLGMLAAATAPALPAPALVAQAPDCPHSACTPAPAPARVAQASPEMAEPSVQRELPGGIEPFIVSWYASQVRPGSGLVADPRKLSLEPDATLRTDPAYRFLMEMEAGHLPQELDALAARVQDGLRTPQRSLSFAALLWRAVQEWCLANPPERRTADQDRVLCEILKSVESAATKWHREVVEKKLDPYLARNRVRLRYRFQMSKAFIRPPAWLDLALRMQTERWGVAKRDAGAHTEALHGFVERHPYAGSMRLDISCRGVTRIRGGAREALAGRSQLGVFDVLVAPPGQQATIEVMSTGEPDASEKRLSWTVTLPAGRQYGYMDVLLLAYQQNARSLDALVADRRIYTGPVLFGAVRASLRSAQAKERADVTDQQLWLADFWMF